MSDLAMGFQSLPLEYQRVICLAQDRHTMTITPLQELSGGWSGAVIYLVSVSPHDTRRVEHVILKLDRTRTSSHADEVTRHTRAMSNAPPEFTRDHIAALAFDRVEHDGAIAIFYRIAGQSLRDYRPLSSYRRQSQLKTIFSATNTFLLAEWNVNLAFEQAVHPQRLLERWLSFRLKPGGNIDSFFERVHVDPDTPGFLISGEVFRNPLVYARNIDRWGTARPIDIVTGFLHGDLNTNNILVKFADDNELLEGYYLIDFALFKEQMPLFYDQRYLEMSYLLLAMSQVSFASCMALITRLAEADILEPHQAPIEMAGACAVIGAARSAFAAWVNENHPSLHDDLWGQYWLAGVAVGLSYCHKAGPSDEHRLAGLIYAAANLRRYAALFDLPAPAEVRQLYDERQFNGAPQGSVGPGSSAVASRHNLPAQPTPFIGRQAEVKAVQDLLLRERVRLVTLTGPGGVGKTRLALEAAAELIDRFADGVYFIDLAALREVESVLAAIARTIGLRETSDRPLLDALKGQLQTQRMLLLLDNVEQVTAAAPTLGELLRACPQLALLTTSREALHMRGEHVVPVPPLALPRADLKQPALEQLTRSEAVQLFVERARAVKPDFQLTNENAAAVAEICVRLDGLPLAIELATARMSLFSPQTLLERMGSRLKLLRGGARDLPARQQTLRDTIDWSYELLNLGEQRLFALLSVFLGCTFEAVEVVASAIKRLDETEVDVLEGLASLVDKSLIRQVDQGTGEPRLLMLETIREYAAERLEAAPQFSAAARQAHASYFADFTRRQWERMTGDRREAAFGALEADIENVRAAWRYWVAQGDLEQLGKCTDGLWLFYDARGWYHATVDLTADLLNVLAATPSTPDRAQQEIMLQTSLARALMAIKGYTPEVEAAYTRALELCQGQGEIPQLLPVLRGLASFYLMVGELEKGAQMGAEILRLAERRDDASMRVEGHLVLGSCLFSSDLRVGLSHLEKAIALYDPDQHRARRFRIGNNPGVACFTTSALVLWMLGFPDRALERADEAVALANRLNHPFSMAYALFHTGVLHLWRRELELVQRRAQAALEIAEEHGFQIWRALAICLQGAALAGMGRAEEGLLQLNRGIGLYQELKTPPIFWPLLLAIRAGVYAQAGRAAEGVILLDDVLERAGQQASDPMTADLYRLKGELLLALAPENPAEAEPWFRQALAIGQQRQASMLELRAAISLSRVWRAQGKAEQGRGLLSDAYGKLTEGFTTADLQEARALLADLSS
ncbi:MAG TPA: NB-ARC domain-containing protein [Roseiflexaceae bacterium]|nr:NB-ARC domain-containing protein [Roseiflexaceae bacterium]